MSPTPPCEICGRARCEACDPPNVCAWCAPEAWHQAQAAAIDKILAKRATR